MKPYVLLALLYSKPLLAHPLDMGLLESYVDDKQVHFTLEVVPSVAADFAGFPPAELTEQTANSKAQVILLATYGFEPLATSAGPCEWGTAKGRIEAGKMNVEATAQCPVPPKSWKMRLPFLKRGPGGFELVVKTELGGKAQQTVASVEKQNVEFSETTEHSWAEFIHMGIQHIGAAPSEWKSAEGWHLPDGIDHILFVLALVIGGGGFLGILKTVTGFTLGHSVTLALATLGVISVPSRLVESAIALSIAFVAGEALFLKQNKSRWKVATLFGLVHGLGFASALGELHLDRASLVKALVGFNIGVEVGQAIIVALALPVLYQLERVQITKRFAIPTSAGMIFLAGSYWFVRRALGI